MCADGWRREIAACSNVADIYRASSTLYAESTRSNKNKVGTNESIDAPLAIRSGEYEFHVLCFCWLHRFGKLRGEREAIERNVFAVMPSEAH